MFKEKKILIRIAFKRSFKGWKVDFFFYKRDRGCLGRGLGKGVCRLEGSSLPEPAEETSWESREREKRGAGCHPAYLCRVNTNVTEKR